jgi:hypothetical protein
MVQQLIAEAGNCSITLGEGLLLGVRFWFWKKRSGSGWAGYRRVERGACVWRLAAVALVKAQGLQRQAVALGGVPRQSGGKSGEWRRTPPREGAANYAFTTSFFRLSALTQGDCESTEAA